MRINEPLNCWEAPKPLIDEGAIDSIKTINALESCLGVELIER